MDNNPMDHNNNKNNNMDETPSLAAASAPPGAMAIGAPLPRPTFHALALELVLMVGRHLGNGSLLALSLTSRRGHDLLLYDLLTRSEDEVQAAAATGPALPTTLITTVLGGTLTPRDTALRTDFFGRVTSPPQPLTNFHRALYHALRRRLPHIIDRVLGLAPQTFVVRGMWVEDITTLAAEHRDVLYEEFLLVRFGEGALREGLASGRMLLDVVARAAGRSRQQGCFGPAIMLLLAYVRRGRRGARRGFVLGPGMGRPTAVEQEQEEGGAVDMEPDLLETMMRMGASQCPVHGWMQGDSCFVAMMELAARKGMIDFTGVGEGELRRWIAALPVGVRARIEFLLASAPGSPLP